MSSIEVETHFPNQSELKDLIRDLGLAKSNAEILTSRLKEWNLLDESCGITIQRERHKIFSQYFTLADKVCFCHDIDGLFKGIGFSYDPNQWRLFIDGSIRSLKAVLLHNGNMYPSIMAHSVHLKENYANVKHLLDLLTYEEHSWEVIGDFEMIEFLSGTSTFPYVKALDKESEAFKYLVTAFPKLSEAKIKGGIFIGPQIRKLMKAPEFTGKLSVLGKRAWQSFVSAVNCFLGSKKEENYRELISDLLDPYKEMGCRMSPKLRMLHSHLDFFKSNMAAYSEEHGERFHQDMLVFEKRYQGECNARMIGDYI